MNSPPLDLSIVIPAFNEEHRLPKAIEQIGSYLSARSLRAEIIVVDDGSSDATPKLIERYRGKYPGLRLISNATNRGKGFSVRHGVLEARGESCFLRTRIYPHRSKRRISCSRHCTNRVAMW